MIISNEEAGNYQFVMRDMIGRPVSTMRLSVPRGTQTVNMPYRHLIRGMYYLTVYDDENKRLQTIKLMIVKE